jgi:hypothetical protein
MPSNTVGTIKISPAIDGNPTDTFGFPAIVTLTNRSFAGTYEPIEVVNSTQIISQVVASRCLELHV